MARADLISKTIDEKQKRSLNAQFNYLSVAAGFVPDKGIFYYNKDQKAIKSNSKISESKELNKNSVDSSNMTDLSFAEFDVDMNLDEIVVERDENANCSSSKLMLDAQTMTDISGH